MTTQPTQSRDDYLVLTDEQRDALSTELFARWNAQEPGVFHCFCGDDNDLLRAVQEARARDERQRDQERE